MASPFLKRAGGYVNQAATAAGFEPPVASQAAREGFDKDFAMLAGQLSAFLGGTDVGTAADVNAAMSSVIAQMAAGDLTADEATIIVGVIEAKREAIETDELDRRLREVEGKLGKRA